MIIDNSKYVRQIGEVNYETIDDVQKFGMGHTRWATHGEVSEKNTHPILYNKWYVVHNGIIQNCERLKQKFNLIHNTDTDTEIIVSLANKFYQENSSLTLIEIIKKITKILYGTYAFILTSEYFPNEMIATCRGSALTFAYTHDLYVLSSDQYTFNELTNKYIVVNDDDILYIDNNGNYTISDDYILQEIDKDVITDLGDYKHYMFKEITEQPDALKNMINGRIINDELKFVNIERHIEHLDTWVLIACGSSYNACICARYFIKNKNIFVEYASDFINRKPIINKSFAYIVLSQSGETRDCISACDYINNNGCVCFGINNRPGCLLDRKTKAGIHMNVGPEYSVAATKTVTASIIILLLLSKSIENIRELIDVIDIHIQKIIHSTKTNQLVDTIEKCTFVIGDDWGFGISKEIALKLQEIVYKPVLSLLGYEMKHGPLALIEENSHVLYFGTSDDIPKILESRGSNVKRILSEDSIYTMICNLITFQIVIYKLAVKLNLPIDKPRNLAKSVTV
jgi:glucosamine--fructose-6-phosphate aminotransferase (isomerizing)